MYEFRNHNNWSTLPPDGQLFNSQSPSQKPCQAWPFRSHLAQLQIFNSHITLPWQPRSVIQWVWFWSGKPGHMTTGHLSLGCPLGSGEWRGSKSSWTPRLDTVIWPPHYCHMVTSFVITAVFNKPIIPSLCLVTKGDICYKSHTLIRYLNDY